MKSAPPEGQDYHDLPFRMDKIITGSALLISFPFCDIYSEGIRLIGLVSEARNANSRFRSERFVDITNLSKSSLGAKALTFFKAF